MFNSNHLFIIEKKPIQWKFILIALFIFKRGVLSSSQLNSHWMFQNKIDQYVSKHSGNATCVVDIHKQ